MTGILGLQKQKLCSVSPKTFFTENSPDTEDKPLPGEDKKCNNSTHFVLKRTKCCSSVISFSVLGQSEIAFKLTFFFFFFELNGREIAMFKMINNSVNEPCWEVSFLKKHPPAANQWWQYTRLHVVVSGRGFPQECIPERFTSQWCTSWHGRGTLNHLLV